MEKFLGILLCGGKGTRLSPITRYISKPFVPVYDRPVFWFGLNLLEKSTYIDEIIILTNRENDDKLKTTGYETVVQDDRVVFDMFSGWEYIKQQTGNRKHGVLMPGDNVSNINVDELIRLFLQRDADIAFSLYKMSNIQKLSQMGCYDPQEKKFYYKHLHPPAPYGVMAPYIVRQSLRVDAGDAMLNHPNAVFAEHHGYWFDIGDYVSIIDASMYIKNYIKRFGRL
ncbi:MAG: nucleotidyltransferase family protein [Candidatus Omnitrophota bacterium]